MITSWIQGKRSSANRHDSRLTKLAAGERAVHKGQARRAALNLLSLPVVFRSERARQLCADQPAKGYYLAGCPVWSKRC